MTDNSAGLLIKALEDVLNSERHALLAGDFDVFPALLDLKEELFDQLNALEAPQPHLLGGVKNKVRQNQVLLDGALQGIRRASVRMAAIRHIKKTLETYGEDGLRRTIEGDVMRTVEKRA